ncbi:sensor histidine kinase [Aeromicrobium sp. Root495]|uniref:sensor histidine kinase n=1 Tax=Aeromicrobium sp. Root495 TaxID=1736550 RepID=UPI001F228C0E|nr:HAMP domain-containing sensor histidine kinase [Aeromicrobium sp. Root495]
MDRTIEAVHERIQPLTSRASLATRVVALTAAAVVGILAVVSIGLYVTVRAQFNTSLDESLLRRAHTAVEAGFAEQTIQGTPTASLALADVKVAVVRGGRLFSDLGTAARPYIGYQELEVSIGETAESARSVKISGRPYRVVAIQAGNGTALVLAQSMEGQQDALERLRLILIISTLGGVFVATVAGWAVATNGLRPVRRLTGAIENVARTAELTPIEVTGTDELARLTIAFNQMLLALDASQERQRQLVADAGHELRTPLTSLRTNIELLGQAAEDQERSLSEGQRREIMDDVRAQLHELTTLVGDLVELAREDPVGRDPEELDLADVVQAAVDRVRPRAAGVTLDVELETWQVLGEPPLLERAVTNLLDNAVKWSPPDGTVTVRLTGGQVVVSDEGPGISAEDLPHVFDRFYRSSEARTLPGSGLGLSIVRRAAERHGGTVSAASAPGEGSVFTMTLPLASEG